jgi:CspA family cold shock protein
MAKGVVRWFHEGRGYGFIEPVGTKDPLYFRHVDVVGRGYRTLREGQPVRFQVHESGRVSRAVDVEAV